MKGKEERENKRKWEEMSKEKMRGKKRRNERIGDKIGKRKEGMEAEEMRNSAIYYILGPI